MFEFYFQSGEFVENGGSFLVDWFIELSGAAAGAGIAVYYAFRQYRRQIADQERERIVQEREIYLNKVKYFSYLVDGSIKFGEGLVDSIKSLASRLAKDIYTIPEIELSSWDDLVRAVELTDREIHYHAYLNLVSDEDIVQVFTDLDLLNRTRLIYVQLHENKYKEDNVRKVIVSKSVKSATLFIKDLKPSKDIEQSFINKLLLFQQNQSDYSLKYGRNYENLSKKYFSPIGQIIYSHHKGFPPALLSELYLHVVEGAVEIENIKTENDKLRMELIQLAPKIEIIINRIRQNSNSMREAIVRVSNE